MMMNRATRSVAMALGLVIAAGAIGCGSPEPADGSRESPPVYQAPTAPPVQTAPQSLPPMDPEPSPNPSDGLSSPPPDDGLGEYPAWNGEDLDCADVGHPVRVTGPDPHRLDPDDDGVGCENQ
jgi:hypothetical protein